MKQIFSTHSPYFRELILKFISFKAKSKSHIKMSFGKVFFKIKGALMQN